jgi:DNA-binding winged helix-turn-helix (wHTH) protein/tetratricopeptide (TPR) repeat protein
MDDDALIAPSRDRHAPFSIGQFLVDPSRNAVESDGAVQSLEPRIMDVLCHLVTHRGEVVSRPAIIDAVWGHAHGADESLTRAISRLRKVFGDTRSPPWLIETVSKRGYRLIAPVDFDRERRAPDGKPEAPVVRARWKPGIITWLGLALAVSALIGILVFWRSPAPARASDEAIFVSLSPFDVIGEGMDGRGKLLAERIAASLSRVSLLRVGRDDGSSGPARSAYRYAIRGTMQRSGERLRVTVTLDDAATHVTLWSGNFDRPLGAGPEADDLPGTIAAELDNRLLASAKAIIRKKPSLELKPWELVLLATWVPGNDEVFLRPHTADSFWLQRRALELDAGYAPAHASLASALAYRAMFTSDADGDALRREARLHAEQARALAPYDSGVLYELSTYYRLIGDRTGALAALDRVLAIQPDHPTATFDRLFLAGHCTAGAPAALAGLVQALSNLSAENPVRWVLLSHIADLHLARGDYAQARQAAEQSRQIVRMTWSGVTLAAAAGALGDSDAARLVSRETRLEWPKLDWDWFAAKGVPLWCLGGAEGSRATAAFHRLGAIDPPRR